MGSSSYLGHGAKYWAERYFELRTQEPRLDASRNLEWREKYLNLEKSCALYQSKIADLRTEVEDLRQKAPPEPEPELFQGHTVEYWFNEVLRAERELQDATAAENDLIETFEKFLADNKESQQTLKKECTNTTAQLTAAENKVQELQSKFDRVNNALAIHNQNQTKLPAKYILLFSVLIIAAFFIGRFSMDTSSNYSVGLISYAIFLVAGLFISYALCSSKYDAERKSQKDSYEYSLKIQKESFTKDLSALVDGLDLLSLSNAPESSYLDQEGLPHMIVDGEDICTVMFTPTGEVFHNPKAPCIKYLRTTNIAYLVPCYACSRCYPTVPDLSWYGRCLSNASILQRYGIKVHIPISPDEAIHRSQISSNRFSSAGEVSGAHLSIEKGILSSLIRSQLANSANK